MRCVYSDSWLDTVLVPGDVVFCHIPPRCVVLTVNVRDRADVDVREDVCDVMRFTIIVPCDNLNNIGLDVDLREMIRIMIERMLVESDSLACCHL